MYHVENKSILFYRKGVPKSILTQVSGKMQEILHWDRLGQMCKYSVKHEVRAQRIIDYANLPICYFDSITVCTQHAPMAFGGDDMFVDRLSYLFSPVGTICL